MTTTNNHLTLIERVGGIEKAKEIVETHPFCYMPHTFKYWSKELDDYVLSTKYATVLVDDLRTAIAQHDQLSGNSGEFKVGDWVYPLSKILDEHEGIGRFILVEKGELVVVRAVKQKGLYVSHEHRRDNSFYVYFSEIRHATPEEIKASRRLDHADNPSHLTEDAVDMVTDICNHISPNTKVINHG